MPRRILVALSTVVLGSAQAAAEDIAAGQALVEAHCASCHAVGRTGESPLQVAPAFRNMFTNYQPADLEEALAEGIVTGHPEMPEWQLEPEDVADVIAYLDGLLDK